MGTLQIAALVSLGQGLSTACRELGAVGGQRCPSPAQRPKRSSVGPLDAKGGATLEVNDILFFCKDLFRSSNGGFPRDSRAHACIALSPPVLQTPSHSSSFSTVFLKSWRA